MAPPRFGALGKTSQQDGVSKFPPNLPANDENFHHQILKLTKIKPPSESKFRRFWSGKRKSTLENPDFVLSPESAQHTESPLSLRVNFVDSASTRSSAPTKPLNSMRNNVKTSAKAVPLRGGVRAKQFSKQNLAKRTSIAIPGSQPEEPYSLSSRLLLTDYHVIHRNHWMESYVRIRELEKTQMIPKYFPLNVQKEVTPKMRSVLVEWMHKVHFQFQLRSEVLFVAVSILDRFTHAEYIQRPEYQLVGILALYMASQKFEVSAPKLDNLLIVADFPYDAEDLRIERQLRQVLGNEVGNALQLLALKNFSRFCNCDRLTFQLGCFVLEVCLHEYELSAFSPSVAALVALSLAISVTGNGQHRLSELIHYSGFARDKLNFSSAILGIHLSRIGGSVIEKYVSEEYGKRCNLPELATLVQKVVNSAQNCLSF